jgi:lipoate-protein ligase A
MWDDTPRPGLDLMARDAARLAAADAAAAAANAAASSPDLLWFTWDRPTITLGRLQSADDVKDAAAAGVPVVVRPTGGRAVFHVDEWTYGAVVSLHHPVLGGSLARACRAITGLIAEALAEAYGIPAELAGEEGERPRVRSDGPGTDGPGSACFAREYGYEIVVEGRKLAGSAQRRGARALLQQGSLLVGPGHERIARWLRGGGGAAGERALARGAVTLSELLGRRPDAAPFRAAVETRWNEAVASAASQASGQAPGRALDSMNARS